MLDVLNGVPAIVVGIFVFGILVVGRGQSAVFGAFALAILMIPMVARATQEILEVVPRSLRDASFALGVTKWRTTWNIVLPAAIGGILTGVVIAVARVAGETAPLLFTSSIAANSISFDIHAALPTLPVLIFTNSESPDPGEQATWAAALVLIAFVLVMNILAKLFAGRKRRQLEGGCARLRVRDLSRDGHAWREPLSLPSACRERRDCDQDGEEETITCPPGRRVTSSISAPTSAAAGIVRIHATRMFPATPQRTAENPRSPRRRSREPRDHVRRRDREPEVRRSPRIDAQRRSGRRTPGAGRSS